MKDLLLILVLVLVSLMVKSQTYIGAVYGNEDKSIGAEVILGRFIFGAESGVCTDEFQYEIEHQKYKLGVITTCDMILDDYTSTFILFGAMCYNDYHKLYDYCKSPKTPEWSFEFGIKKEISNSIYFGFNYDIIQDSGSWTLGFMIF